MVSYLHIPTLAFSAVSVAFVTSGLLLLSWWQNRAAQCLLHWGFGNLIGAVGAMLLVQRGLIPDTVSIIVANALLILSYGMLWSGARLFEGKSSSVIHIGAGPLIWIGACAFSEFYTSLPARVIATNGLLLIYVFATINEFYRGGRGLRLKSRVPALIWLTLHAGFLALRFGLIVTPPNSDATGLMANPWMSVIILEGMLHIVVTTFTMIALTKDGLEHEQRHAASTDALTGVVSRRSFFERGEAIFDEAGANHDYAAIMAIDLDNFKSINDQWGHAAGDEVLQSFAVRAQRALGPNVLFARLGGEEFAVIVTGRDHASVYELAENLRRTIAEAQIRIAGREKISISISIGVAFAGAVSGYHLETLLRNADEALYCAKHNGRDRIEIFTMESTSLTVSKAIRGFRAA